MRLRRAPLLALALLAVTAGSAHAASTQESMFQDDDELEFSPPDEVARTINTLARLGVDRIRLSVFWLAVAPEPNSQTKPKAFDGTNPDNYPNGSWDRYDTVVKLAQAKGIGVLFDITGPAPKWATPNPEREDIDATYQPSPAEFGAFVAAVGTRYSGSFVRKEDRPAPPAAPEGGGLTVPTLPPPPGAKTRQAPVTAAPLPRVDTWEVWNEPNQAGWLTPQWLPGADGKQQIETAPTIYRGLTDAMTAALRATGHGSDTILVGATAPKGLNVKGVTRSIKPLRFLRQLYCLDDHLQFLKGPAAAARGCPETNQVTAFPEAHPGLFSMTGWSHHPYELTFAPDRAPTDPDYATIANLKKLSDMLRRIYQRYGIPLPTPRGVPLYLTEFGYQTNPPDRLGVSAAKQATYLMQAEYIAYRNPLVRTLSQFLLVDGGDPVGLTFQSGLRFRNGKAKPSMAAYRFPVWLPKRTARRGTKISVFGLARAAPSGATVSIQFRRKGATRWRTLATRATTKRRGYLSAQVSLPGSGAIRLLQARTASRALSVRAR
jgi:hypothetical protein